MALGISAAAGQVPPPSLGELVIQDVGSHVVAKGESLECIAGWLGADPLVLARRNGGWVHAQLVAGTTLTVDALRIVPTGSHPAILVNIPQLRLFVRERATSVHPVPAAVGSPDWPTPVGEFRVIWK